MALRHNPRYDDPPREAPRLHEYWIEGAGISREVIQADICRYLGNDALVRPGHHQVRPPSCCLISTCILIDCCFTIVYQSLTLIAGPSRLFYSCLSEPHVGTQTHLIELPASVVRLVKDFTRQRLTGLWCVNRR
jgi:hypothetical protein